MSLCISVLAVTDTIVLCIALCDYLTDEANVSLKPCSHYSVYDYLTDEANVSLKPCSHYSVYDYLTDEANVSLKLCSHYSM